MFSVIAGLFTRIFSNAFSNVLQKKLTFDGEHSSVINFYTYLGMTMLGSLFCKIPIFTPEILKFVFIMGMLGALGNYFIIKALSYGELSVMAPINSYKPVVALILGITLLNEIPSVLDIIGIALIICGTFILFKGGKCAYKALVCRALALIFSGSEAIFIKKIILLSDIKSAFLYWALAGLFFAGIFCLKNGIKLSKQSINPIIILIFTTALMQYSTNFVFSKMEVSCALALFQLSTLISVFFGVRMFNEKNLSRKLLASVVMLFGAVIILIL